MLEPELKRRSFSETEWKRSLNGCKVSNSAIYNTEVSLTLSVIATTTPVTVAAARIFVARRLGHLITAIVTVVGVPLERLNIAIRIMSSAQTERTVAPLDEYG